MHAWYALVVQESQLLFLLQCSCNHSSLTCCPISPYFASRTTHTPGLEVQSPRLTARLLHWRCLTRQNPRRRKTNRPRYVQRHSCRRSTLFSTSAGYPMYRDFTSIRKIKLRYSPKGRKGPSKNNKQGIQRPDLYSPTDWRSRSQCPRGLRHETSSPARTLGSWVRNPLQALTSVFILCLCCPVCR
jgi:hypothetical protein